VRALRAEIVELLGDVEAVLKKRNVVGDAYLTDEYPDGLLSEIEDCLKRLYSLRPRAERSGV
jgi:hypothetical protein